MPALDFLFRYLLLPLGVAVIMYMIVHIQLMLMHKVLDLGLTHQKRTRINLITFFSVFFGVLILVIINQYLTG